MDSLLASARRADPCRRSAQSWIGRPKFMLEGLIYQYTPGEDSEGYTKMKQVPSDKVVAQIEGVWRKQIKWKRKGEKVRVSRHHLARHISPRRSPFTGVENLD